MSKQNIGDTAAGILLAIFVLPPLRQALVQAFCNPSIVEIAAEACWASILFFIVLPILSGIWFVIRIAHKLGIIDF